MSSIGPDGGYVIERGNRAQLRRSYVGYDRLGYVNLHQFAVDKFSDRLGELVKTFPGLRRVGTDDATRSFAGRMPGGWGKCHFHVRLHFDDDALALLLVAAGEPAQIGVANSGWVEIGFSHALILRDRMGGNSLPSAAFLYEGP